MRVSESVNSVMFYTNVSVNSKPDHSPRRPQGFARPHCPGDRVFAQLSLPGGRGFELKKFSTVLKEKCRNFSNCFKETGGSSKGRCSSAVSCQFLQKTGGVCFIFNNTDHFRPFQSF